MAGYPSVFEYTSANPIQFMEGDIFGMYYANEIGTRFTVFNQVLIGPVNYQAAHGILSAPANSILVPELSPEYDYPMITVEISTFM